MRLLLHEHCVFSVFLLLLLLAIAIAIAIAIASVTSPLHPPYPPLSFHLPHLLLPLASRFADLHSALL
jgi:hypothetical protein